MTLDDLRTSFPSTLSSVFFSVGLFNFASSKVIYIVFVLTGKFFAVLALSVEGLLITFFITGFLSLDVSA